MYMLTQILATLFVLCLDAVVVFLSILGGKDRQFVVALVFVVFITLFGFMVIW